MKRHADLEGRPHLESAGPLFEPLHAVPPAPLRTVPEPPTVLAGVRRDAGMARAKAAAKNHHKGWEIEACAQVHDYARSHQHFATEDVRARYGTPADVDPKAWGPAMKRAAKLGLVKADGFVLVDSSNRSPKVRWRSLVYQGSTGP